MGRYHILLNKTPEVTPVVENKKIHQFGFEQDFQSKYKETQKKQRLFRLNDNESARIGFVHEEGRKDIFSGASIHFHGRTRFFCKSTSHRTALCCSSTYAGKHPTLRIAIPIIRYSELGQSHDIMPWVFGKTMFNLIKEMNDIRSVDQYDLTVSNRTSLNPFSHYGIQIAPEDSLWRQLSNKELILQNANALRQNIMPYLAEDLDENAIEAVLSQPPTTWQERPAPQQRHTDDDSLFDTNDRAAPPPPRERHHGMEPMSEPSALRDMLNSVLDSI